MNKSYGGDLNEKRIFIIVLTTILVIASIFVFQHWQEFQAGFYLPDDTSALARFFFQHYLVIGVLRAFLVYGGVLTLFLLSILVFKIFSATSFGSSILNFQISKEEFESLAEKYEETIESLKQQLMVKEVMEKLK